MPKKKEAAPTEVSSEKEAEVVEEAKTETPDVSGDTDNLSEREKMYARHAETERAETTEESKEDEKSEEVKEEDKPKTEEFKKEEEAPKETKQEEKTVPLPALHEERSKRKEAQAKVIDLESRLKEALEAKKEKSDSNDEEYIEDYDVALKKERQRGDALEARLKVIEDGNAQSTAEKNQAVVNQKAKKVHDELKDEGFDGFEAFTPQVKQHIYDLILQQPDAQEYLDGKKVLDVDNPEGWKNIYKEHIYPKIRQVFDTKDKKDLLKERNERKLKAGLSGNSGGKPKMPEVKDVNSLSQKEMNDQYMQMRRKQGAATV
ncbi:MAG: hypothetical protein CMD96_08200 [Gammaproteobacteria bacterium]|nr:hypothetical protein [Gammaproteobacteria bacterium]|tara:strand:- start:348 stop:1301 length:954 start_codon:yes stop_codon:yes gene_type:complete